MKLQQLRFLDEVERQGLVISRAASVLHTSQSAISKQLMNLETELGITLFERRGKHLHSLTEAGRQILGHARRVLAQTNAIRNIADEHRDEEKGSLTLATTHTQSRYVLPKIITRFMETYPGVSLQMHQGSPVHIAQQAADGTADFAIATEALEFFDDLVMMPCFRWNRAILVPTDHPLTTVKKVTLKQLVEYPLITYDYGFTGRTKLDAAFEAENLKPNVVFTAVDADVIKTYVRLKLGVGIIASMAIEPERDTDLVALDARHLFDDSITRIGFRKETWLRQYMYDFIEMFAPHLTRQAVDETHEAFKQGRQDISELISAVDLPAY